jgi:hypothetical protein
VQALLVADEHRAFNFIAVMVFHKWVVELEHELRSRVDELDDGRPAGFF